MKLPVIINDLPTFFEKALKCLVDLTHNPLRLFFLTPMKHIRMIQTLKQLCEQLFQPYILFLKAS